MRIDKFLSTVNLVKRRAISEDMLEHNVVFLNGNPVKKAKEIKVGDIIEIRYIEYIDKYEVLAIPTTKSTPKSKQADYVKKLD
ncbi:MAG: S4 domain-containing protein [Arcobacteraceae bacterium]